MEKIPNPGRRRFIKDAGIFATGALIAPETLLSKSKENSSKEFITSEVEKCKKIIESKNYDDIVKNPYLVSALYYSDQYRQELINKKQSGQKQIVAEIYPLIDRELREGYMNSLSAISAHQEKLKGLNFETKCNPLEDGLLPENLEENHRNALDIFAKEGSVISAMASGIVVLAENGWREGNEFSTSSNLGGNTVIIFNPKEKSFYRYAHMQNVDIALLDGVTSGEHIGSVGKTGENANKQIKEGHLHLEINKYNNELGIMESEEAQEIKDTISHL